MSKALLSFDGAAFNQRNKDMLRYACILKFNDLFLDGIIVFIVVAAVFEKLFSSFLRERFGYARC